MPQLQEMIKDTETIKVLKKASHEHVRGSYKERLDDIVMYCRVPRKSREVSAQFGYAKASVSHPLKALVTSGLLMKSGRGTYVAVNRREVTPEEREELRMPVIPTKAAPAGAPVAGPMDKYLELLETDLKDYMWSILGDATIIADTEAAANKYCDLQATRNFMDWTRKQHGSN